MNDPQNTVLMPRTRSLWGVAASLALIVGICGATLAPQMSRKEVRQTNGIISKLPQSERLTLERNLDAYLKLSEAEKMQYWEMHRHVEEHNLFSLVDDYKSWLKTLSPYARQALRTSTEPVAKIVIVEKIIKSQQKIKEHRLPEFIARIIETKLQEENQNRDFRNSTYRDLSFFFSNQAGLDFTNQYVLSEPQLIIFTDEILYSRLNSSQRQALDAEKTEGIKRISKILRLSIELSNNAILDWPSRDIFTAMEEEGISFESNESSNKNHMLRRIMSQVVGHEILQEMAVNEFGKRFAFRRMLIRSIMVYEMRQYESKNPVRDNELFTFFKKLESSKQAVLLDEPSVYQAEALKWYYIWEVSRKESIFSDAKFGSALKKMMPTPRPGFNRGGPRNRGGARPGKKGPPPPQ